MLHLFENFCWFFFYFGAVSLLFFDKCITKFSVFKISCELCYHISVNFPEACLILFRAFFL